MGSRTNSTVGSAADAAVAIAGSANTVNQDRSVQMQDEAKIIGGENTELGIGASIMKLGDNSSLSLQSMDGNTKDLLLSMVNVLGQNSDNFMSLSSGREPSLDLPNQTQQITATVAANPISTFLKSKSKIILAVAAIAAGVWLWRSKK